jgi:hypothetical protein
MRQHRNGQRLDVVGNHEIPARDQSQALCGAIEGQCAARAHADVQVLAAPRHVHDIEQVLGDRAVDPDLADAMLEPEHIVGPEHRTERLDRLAVPVAGKNPALLRADRITHPQPDHESVELAFRKHVRPLEFVGVLRGQHDEGRIERIRLSLHRDLAVTHGFQKRALGSRRGTVDLVGQDDVGKKRTGLENELSAGPVVDA